MKSKRIIPLLVVLLVIEIVTIAVIFESKYNSKESSNNLNTEKVLTSDDIIFRNPLFYEINKDGPDVFISSLKNGSMQKTAHDLYIKEDEWELVTDCFLLHAGENSFSLVGDKLYNVNTSLVTYNSYIRVIDVYTGLEEELIDITIPGHELDEQNNENMYFEAEIVNHDASSITVIWRSVEWIDYDRNKKIVGLIVYDLKGCVQSILYLQT